jgi:hypothetical protein
VRFRWPLRCGPCCPAKLNRIELLRCACIAARYCRSVRRENCKCAARGMSRAERHGPELETTRRTIPRGRLPHGSKCEILAASKCFPLFPQETFDSASRTLLLAIACGCAGPEICNFSQCRCSPCGRKGRPKLTSYACLSLDDQRRPQEFAHRD